MTCVSRETFASPRRILPQAQDEALSRRSSYRLGLILSSERSERPSKGEAVLTGGETLLPHAELAEYAVQQVLRIDGPRDPSQGPGCQPQILGYQLGSDTDPGPLEGPFDG